MAPRPPPPCIICMAALIACGFIIYRIISGFWSMDLICGLFSIICLSIGLLLTVCWMKFGSASICCIIGLCII